MAKSVTIKGLVSRGDVFVANRGQSLVALARAKSVDEGACVTFEARDVSSQGEIHDKLRFVDSSGGSTIIASGTRTAVVAGVSEAFDRRNG